MLLLGLAALAVAAGIHGSFHLLAQPETRPVPILASCPWVIASVGIAGLLASGAAAGRRAKGLMATGGMVFLHVVLGMAGLTGVLMSDPAFPFGPNYVESMALPGDEGTAYLYRGGLFCSQTVRRSEPGSWWSTRDSSIGAASCEVDGSLGWDSSAGEIEIVGPDGQRVPGSGEKWRKGFDWRPH